VPRSAARAASRSPRPQAYNPADPFSTPGAPATINGAFTPMHWCTKGLANATIPAGTNATFLLGFNE